MPAPSSCLVVRQVVRMEGLRMVECGQAPTVLLRFPLQREVRGHKVPEHLLGGRHGAAGLPRLQPHGVGCCLARGLQPYHHRAALLQSLAGLRHHCAHLHRPTALMQPAWHGVQHISSRLPCQLQASHRCQASGRDHFALWMSDRDLSFPAAKRTVQHTLDVPCYLRRKPDRYQMRRMLRPFNSQKHAILGKDKDTRWGAYLHGDAQQLEEALLRRPEELEHVPALPCQLHCLTQRIPQVLRPAVLMSFTVRLLRFSVRRLSQAVEPANATQA